jgi:GT2 family glycosyltransferase
MISVIMPTYNRADMLAKVLPTYIESNVVREVLVVNDGSQDHTSDVVKQFHKQDSRIRLVEHPQNMGMTQGRNTAIAHATGDFLLTSEDDLALAPGSLETLLEHMQSSNADIIGGRRVWMRLNETPEQALQRANTCKNPPLNRRWLDYDSHAITPTDLPMPLVNASMLIRRCVIEQVWYDNAFAGNGWREDSDFQLTAQELGFKVVFCPHSVFYHYDRAKTGLGSTRLKSNWNYLRWIYRNNLTFLQKHHAFLKTNIPEALIMGSPEMTNWAYIVLRAAWLLRSETRRIWQSRNAQYFWLLAFGKFVPDLVSWSETFLD